MSRNAPLKDPLDVEIVEHLAEQAKRPLKQKEIAKGLGIGDERYPDLKDALSRLCDEGRIYKIKGQRYAVPEQINLVVGRMDSTKKGAGFVVSERQTEDQDLFVPPHKMGGATHRDRVVARIEKRKGKDQNPEGSVIRVLDRARTQVVGALQKGKRFGFVVLDNPRLNFDVYVAAEDLAQAKEGEKVVVKIDDWGDGKKNPEGHVVEVLGAPDEPGVDVLSIIYTHGLELEFPEEVERAAEEIDADIEAEAKRREDLRGKTVFTIDPVDAKDFDDALSIERKGDDLFEIGIHIADVSHYVRPDTVIDEEAFERATSVYLVDRVIPMLPERLSNGLCSLRPEEDRLAYSVILEIDGEGDVKTYRIVESVIRSDFRLTYAEAQSLIESKPAKEEHKALLWEVQTLRRLGKTLKTKRAARGSLDFDLPEAIVELDDDGFPIDIKESVRLDSMRLIEEFMLLANETVAKHAADRKVPFVYRVHDRPAPDKVEQIRQFLAALGYHLPKSEDGLHPKQFGEIIDKAKGTREEELINTVILRSMKQARYQTENVGHFGLGAEHYAHFTSPIRRYPDLVVHRVLKAMEAGERWKGDEARAKQQSWLDRAAEHASVEERVAVQAERDSIDLKKVEFMQRHMGEEFDGTIAGVTSFGFFVRLDQYFVEGLVHMHELDDDYYVFHEDKYALIGRNTGNTFRLADPVRVKVVGVNKDQGQIDFELVKEKDGKKETGGG